MWSWDSERRFDFGGELGSGTVVEAVIAASGINIRWGRMVRSRFVCIYWGSGGYLEEEESSFFF